jgi:hypothetical protein
MIDDFDCRLAEKRNSKLEIRALAVRVSDFDFRVSSLAGWLSHN